MHPVSPTGNKPQKHVLKPSDEDGSPDEEEDPVCALEWDPLSVDYLLVANAQHGVRLVDTSGNGPIAVIMTFVLPSAAAQVHTLSWISSAPGMFVTGGRFAGGLWTDRLRYKA
jgi:WD40 repeat protein